MPSRGRLLAVVVSLVLHGVLLYAISLAFVVYFKAPPDQAFPAMTATFLPPETDVSPIIVLEAPLAAVPVGTPQLPDLNEIAATLPEPPEIPAPLAGRSSTNTRPPETPRERSSAAGASAATSDHSVGGGFEGRQADARAQLVAQRGGSPQSEAAVERGLTWIIAHQHDDGGWRFDHTRGPCNKRCRNPGNHESTTAATALALLPLLGAGHSAVQGVHQQSVARGLAYLRSRMIVTPSGGDFQEGTMYAQGLSAIALAEAYALGGDPEIGEAAQRAIDYIAAVQHPAGGWRYFPGQPGDTTVLGWQWMALKSGQLAGLSVPPRTLQRARLFLDSIETDDGAAYGYQHADAERTPTAIGLLCRMYSGWRRDDPRIIRGVGLLAAWGPSYDDMYFNYYATQVLHHAETPAWEAWNARLRDHLIATQSLRGHEAGSWHFADYHTAPGGRLCDTALALMILEVYYRHMPLYGYKSVEF
jgi:Squalene-hopene cyclase C-terminal domain